ncbi:MAG: acylphosphatase [Methylococcales bacterium]|nr:MAG: acylphosphatase [Methylococcales bacterium]
MLNRVRVLVSGRVQGVYFRAFTRKKAVQLGINGYARNLADGQVEIVAEADEAILEKFISWCHKGPITARVDQVIVTSLVIDEGFTGFEIR